MAGRTVGAVLVADVVSTLGTEMAAVALPWFVLVSTGSPGRMAGVMAAEFVGMGVAGIPAGHFAHRAGARRSLLVADGVRSLLVLLVPLLHWAGALHYGVLLVVGLAVGAMFPAYTSAQRLVLASVVGDDEVRLTQLGGVMGAVNESASFAGPALGGLLVAAVGAPVVLVVDAASYAASFVLLFTAVSAVRTAAGDDEPVALTSGLQWLRRDPLLRRHVGATMFGELGWTALMAVLPVAARRHYGGGAALAGALVAAYGVGSVLGGLVSSRMRRVHGGIGRWALVAGAAVAWVLVATPPAWLTAVAVAGFGVAHGIYFPRLFAVLALRPPARLRGPVMTAAQTAMSWTGPLGFVVAGLLLERSSLTAALAFVAAAASACGGLAAIAQPLTAGVDVERSAAHEPQQGEA